MAGANEARPSRTEPLFWSLFGAGGMLAALLFPVHVAVLGIAFAAGWLPDDALSYQRIIDIVRFPLTKLYLAALIALPLFHAAHRLRFTVHHELGIHGGKRLVAAALYGGAAAGSAAAAWVLLSI